MERHEQIEDQAAEWLARLDSGNWSAEDERRLREWLGASTAHRVVYLRLKSTWDAAARLRALRAGLSPSEAAGGSVPAPGEWRRSPFFEQSASAIKRGAQHVRSETFPDAWNNEDLNVAGACDHAPAPRQRKRGIGLAAAASVLLAATLGFYAYTFWTNAGERYMTAVGGFASVPMSDGSKITLNTDSEIRVAVTDKERRIDLEQGEAYFEVAPDETRPFVVRAGNKRVVAVGTKFSVQNFGEEVRVVVTEGKVRVEGTDNRKSTADSAAGSAVLLAAGDIARVEGAAVLVERAPPPQLEELLSWREGYLRFKEIALADAIAQINRYNTRKIFIEDPEVAAMKISGTFRPTQYEAFVRVLQEGFSIQARSDGERIVLTQ